VSMSVTHDMIAAKIGINRTTVTKALKGDPSIRELTRKKVIEIASAMGYDFKQSQQNRRDGKRFFVKEEVDFSFFDRKTSDELVRGRGLLTNLSSTGLLLKIYSTETNSIPLGSLGVRILSTNRSMMRLVPEARIVRVNFGQLPECAARFDKTEQMTSEDLMRIEETSFSKV